METMTETIILTESTMPNYYDANGRGLREDYSVPFQSPADAYNALAYRSGPMTGVLDEVIRITWRDGLSLYTLLHEYFDQHKDFPVSPAIIGKLLSGGWVLKRHALELMEALECPYSIEVDES